MIKPEEILEFNRILQEKCDDYDECTECPLKRENTYYGCMKDNQMDRDEARRLINFVYGERIYYTND